ncbi:MAG TPA: tripartite tricarboxylate transporter substrate binding protein [Burkholderiales bacterium]|nr:tripartite tricarboxylate transporter substrate binding protein [Burkholderiales bacterium]
MKPRLLAAIAFVVAATTGASSADAQQNYPSRPIRVLIPFPAGGAADTIGRTIAEPLSAQLRQTVVLDNRPGAAGRLATEMLAKAEPDGHTLLVGGVGPISISPSLYSKLNYDVERDFVPITMAAELINVMVVNPSIGGAGGIQDFVAWAKKRPGDVRFGSSGPGQLDHLAGEFFQRLTGLKMIHVPYKGGGPALVDLVSGDIQLMFATYVTALPHIKGGRLRAIAVVTPERQPLLPELPAVGEVVPGFGIRNWNGFFAPAGTPRPIADRLFVEINKAMLVPEVKRRQNAAGIVPSGSSSRAEFANFIREDTARWAKIIREAGIRIE